MNFQSLDCKNIGLVHTSIHICLWDQFTTASLYTFNRCKGAGSNDGSFCHLPIESKFNWHSFFYCHFIGDGPARAEAGRKGRLSKEAHAVFEDWLVYFLLFRIMYMITGVSLIMIENHVTGVSSRVNSVLFLISTYSNTSTQTMSYAWQIKNFDDPYPSEEEKARLVHITGVTLRQVFYLFLLQPAIISTHTAVVIFILYTSSRMGMTLAHLSSKDGTWLAHATQINNWFSNNRVRVWRPCIDSLAS